MSKNVVNFHRITRISCLQHTSTIRSVRDEGLFWGWKLTKLFFLHFEDIIFAIERGEANFQLGDRFLTGEGAFSLIATAPLYLVIIGEFSISMPQDFRVNFIHSKWKIIWYYGKCFLTFSKHTFSWLLVFRIPHFSHATRSKYFSPTGSFIHQSRK